MASVADAPQIETAPPLSSPKRSPRRSARASATPIAIVSTMPPAASAMALQPSVATSASVMRSPRSATPARRTAREAISMPGRNRASAMKLKAMPSSSANTMALSLNRSEK